MRIAEKKKEVITNREDIRRHLCSYWISLRMLFIMLHVEREMNPVLLILIIRVNNCDIISNRTSGDL